MTESEWTSGTDVRRMLVFLRNHWRYSLKENLRRVGLLRRAGRSRKLRLLACGVLRYGWSVLDDIDRRAVGVAERYADGLAEKSELAVVGSKYNILSQACASRTSAWEAVECAVEWVDLRSEDEYAASIGKPFVFDPHFGFLIRDVFGPLPFRPITLDPSWLTADVVGLARTIYEARAFDRLPVLADALMDAGCADDEVLSHCRSTGPHVLGCWVVGLVLGKE
jgi:hypothetical protein